MDTTTSVYLLRSSNMSGRIKFSSDHNSARLFCNGVPVNNNLLPALYDLRILQIKKTISHIPSCLLAVVKYIRVFIPY